MSEQEKTVAEKPVPELNLNDLAAIKNLIEVVTSRGVFKAGELSAAGALFDKLNSFLEAASQQQTPQESVEQQEE